MSAVFIILVIVGALSGAAVGFFRKLTKTSFWGVVVLLTLLLERAIGSAVKKESGNYGVALLIATVVILIVLTIVAAVLKQLLCRVVAARKRLSHYKHIDDVEESEALILNAVDSNDKHEYKRQLKKRRRIKENAGGWGIVDGVLGAVSGGLNAVLGIGVVILAVLLFADLSELSFMNDLFGGCLQSASWVGLGAKIALDLPLISILYLSISMGYKSGISTVLCIAVILGMIVGFGAAAYAIAGSAACAGAVDALCNGLLSGISGMLGESTAVVAKVIIAGIIFLLSLVVIILVGIFLPKIMEKLRDYKAFCAVDGVLGAILQLALVVVLLMVFGGIAYSLCDLEFMTAFNSYAEYAAFGDALYTYNPMASVFASLPLKDWLSGAPAPQS